MAVCVCECMCMCVYMYVCVCDRETEGERQTGLSAIWSAGTIPGEAENLNVLFLSVH